MNAQPSRVLEVWVACEPKVAGTYSPLMFLPGEPAALISQAAQAAGSRRTRLEPNEIRPLGLNRRLARSRLMSMNAAA
jgi:hypothetical protein